MSQKKPAEWAVLENNQFKIDDTERGTITDHQHFWDLPVATVVITIKKLWSSSWDSFSLYLRLKFFEGLY